MRIWESTVFILTSRKTEIARSARGQKITRAPCRGRVGRIVPRAEFFWVILITADHKVLSHGARLDYHWIQSYPCKTKTSQETQKSLQKFLEPNRKPKVSYTHNLARLVKISPGINCTSTPHKSETNGIAERAVRRVKEGTSAVLLQSGLNESWWADSMECYTYLRNIQDLLYDGKTPYERRFGQQFKGPIIPFGSLVEYYPISAKDQLRIHQFRKKVLPGLFLGYALYASGIWKGDVLIADLEELETMDAAEIYSKRLNAKEVIFPKENGKFIFPVADGRIKFVKGNQELRTSTLIRDHPTWGEDQRDFLRESEGSPPPLVSTSTTSRLTSGCRWSKKWFLVHFRKLYIPPSRWRWTQSQTLLAERRIIPHSTEIHWRLQNCSHTFGYYARRPHRWLLEYRWIQRFVWFLDRFHPVYSVEWETFRRTYVVWGETDKTASDIQARSFMARTLERNVKER